MLLSCIDRLMASWVWVYFPAGIVLQSHFTKSIGQMSDKACVLLCCQRYEGESWLQWLFPCKCTETHCVTVRSVIPLRSEALAVVMKVVAHMTQPRNSLVPLVMVWCHEGELDFCAKKGLRDQLWRCASCYIIMSISCGYAFLPSVHPSVTGDIIKGDAPACWALQCFFPKYASCSFQMQNMKRNT